MRRRHAIGKFAWLLRFWVILLSLSYTAFSGDLLINEVLFNPPGPDAPNQYIELRGTPNLVLPTGTYFLVIEGKSSANPGTVRNVFDLSGRSVGGNGFLLLLQKTNSYRVNSNATVLINEGSGLGWGSGSSSSIGHRGDNGATDMEHPSATYFLIQTTNAPTIDIDIDSDDDGIPDLPEFAGWNVLDAVGVLSDHGPGDCAYGLINFRRNTAPGNGASAPRGTLVPISFTPSYVARQGNSAGWAASDWAAGDNLAGTAPDWALSPGATVPTNYVGLPLDHLGSPNFDAPDFPGIIAWIPGGRLEVSESGLMGYYTLGLNTSPARNVDVQIRADAQVEVSLDGGTNFGGTRTVVFSNTVPVTITVRAIDDNVVDIYRRSAYISHLVSATADPVQYPVSSLAPIVPVRITDNDTVLLNELKINPPGTNDVPFQYIELKGQPGTLLTNVYFLAIEGSANKNPGTALLVIDLGSNQLGSNGLLAITGPGSPYPIPAGTSVLVDPHLADPLNGLKSDSVSFLLVTSPRPILDGEDLDQGDNGILEGLPKGTTILDAVGWHGGNPADLVYGGVTLTSSSWVPDAAIRFPGDSAGSSQTAWCYGDLAGTNAASLVFDSTKVSANFPVGMALTPGAANAVPLTTTPIAPLCGDIGDPTNPQAAFKVYSADATNLGSVVVSAFSSNLAVAAGSNLVLQAQGGGAWTLDVSPVGVGYSTITVTVSQGEDTGQISFPYAASNVSGESTRFHTGASDASTAIALDQNLMLEGDNENQVIRLYSRQFSGFPLREYDMSPFLNLGSQEHGEMNIEGSTRVGNRVFWIGAHSHNNLGDTRTNRSRVFGVDLSGSGTNTELTYVGRYEFLKSDLIQWDSSNAHGKGTNYYGLAASAADNVDPKADDGSGFNIEGLTMAPGSTQVGWIGFRAPLVPATNRAKALIIPVLNFRTLAVSGAISNSAVFGDAIELNLGCRGIRSIEAGTNGVLISAGPTGRATVGTLPKDFRLFTWSGSRADLPEEHGTDLSGLSPEGIVELPPVPWTANSLVQLVSDDGTYSFYGDGVETKHLPVSEFKKFRSAWVALGEPRPTQPCIRSIERVEDHLILSWCSVPGHSYRVQTKAGLEQIAWADAGPDILATDAVTETILPLTSADRAFYRVVFVQ